jgi:transcriptional regulator with XRE-family HTH domain
VDVPLLIRARLATLGLEQRDLARAAQVTESYISQLLKRKKAPPAPGRTDIYGRMDKFLQLPSGELARLAAYQRKEQLKRTLGDEAVPVPLFPDLRALILNKCNTDKVAAVRSIFERQPFGELERLVAQKLLDVAKRAAKEELENEKWIRGVARRTGRSYEAARVRALEFLDTDIFHLSLRDGEAFLGPLIDSWDVDLATFGLKVNLNRRVTTHPGQRFEFAELPLETPDGEEPGLRSFLNDPALSGTATESELTWLKQLPSDGRHPTALFYYRALQVLRDPLHFKTGGR